MPPSISTAHSWTPATSRRATHEWYNAAAACRRAGSPAGRRSPAAHATSRPWPGCGWPGLRWPGWTSPPRVTAPPTTRSTGPGPGLQARIGRARARIDGDQATEPDGLTDRELRRALNAAEHPEMARLYDDGTISQPTRQRLQRSLDLEAARLGDDQH